MKQGWSLLLTVLCAAVILVWAGHNAFSAESPLADKTTTIVGLRKTNAASSSSSTATLHEDSEQAVRRLIADVDEAALARYKADTPGFRRHPSYYSDKYLTRARGPDASMGSWTLVDSKSAIRPGDDFYNQYPNRDVPWQDFPETTAWQKDATYLPQFLDQGIALVERALEAILTEYGYGSDRDDRPFEERLSILTNPSRNTMPGKSFEGLVRRVLHSIVTQDTFTLAMSGHSAAAGTCAKTNVFVHCLCVYFILYSFIGLFIHSLLARFLLLLYPGHGNHFQQSYTHAYGVIVEPIFARLGVHAMSRNFGFGGLGTIQTGIAASALMGPDVDVLMWDSGMTEKGSAIGVLGVQAALAGDRIPVYLSTAAYGNPLNSEVGMDVGSPGNFVSFAPMANTREELDALPWASQCLRFGNDLKPVCGGNHYRGICWLDRSDFIWNGMNMSYTPVNTKQKEPGGRAGWHPGDRVHQIRGRGLAGLVLSGIRDALLLWKNSENLVLKDEDWHGECLYTGYR